MSVPVRSATELLRELVASEPDAESNAAEGWCVDCGEWVAEHGAALVALAEQDGFTLAEMQQVREAGRQAEARVAELEQEAERWEKAHDMAADMYADRAARVDELEAELARLHNDLGGESMRCERAEGRVAELETALRRVPEAYEAKVSAALDHRLPPHTEDCDEAWTTGRCLRCDVLAGVQVAYGFARPLAAGSPTGQEQQA